MGEPRRPAAMAKARPVGHKKLERSTAAQTAQTLDGMDRLCSYDDRGLMGGGRRKTAVARLAITRHDIAVTDQPKSAIAGSCS